MTPEVTIAPELIGEWKRYQDGLEARNNARRRKHEIRTATFNQKYKKSLEVWRETIERIRADRELERSRVDEACRQFKELRWFRRFPWRDPSNSANPIYAQVRGNLWDLEIQLADAFDRKLDWQGTQRWPAEPKFEEKSIVNFLSWLADQKDPQS